MRKPWRSPGSNLRHQLAWPMGSTVRFAAVGSSPDFSRIFHGIALLQSEKFLNLGTLTSLPSTVLARKVVRHTRPVCQRKMAPAKLVSTTTDVRAFVAKAPHLTMHAMAAYSGIRRQASLVKCSRENSQGHISETTRWILFLNDGTLDKCLSKKKICLATPALCQTRIEPIVSPLRSPLKRRTKTTALIRQHPVT